MTERQRRLAGVRVLVTRPEPAAGRLAEAFAGEGAKVFRVPALAIVPVEDTHSAERLRERLADVSAVVFTSVNAVEGFFGLMPDTVRDRLPEEVLAVGRATARALCLRAVAGVRTPSGRSDSEGLLACPQLSARRVAGRLVAVVKGEGGRDLLARELGSRGAEVLEANVYRRRAPERIAQMLGEVRESIDVVTATSAETLENLLDAAPWTASWLARRTVVTVSERVAGVARARNLSQVAVARGADAASIVEATVRAVAGLPHGCAMRGSAPPGRGQDGR
ncbi:MAG: uroporphyrinogen-III synthase [Acidobacteriota bacterium]|nr:uroporphyrinogen-III synthase [Acidobacteriota bacterium]